MSASTVDNINVTVVIAEGTQIDEELLAQGISLEINGLASFEERDPEIPSDVPITHGVSINDNILIQGTEEAIPISRLIRILTNASKDAGLLFGWISNNEDTGRRPGWAAAMRYGAILRDSLGSLASLMTGSEHVSTDREYEEHQAIWTSSSESNDENALVCATAYKQIKDFENFLKTNSGITVNSDSVRGEIFNDLESIKNTLRNGK